MFEQKKKHSGRKKINTVLKKTMPTIYPHVVFLFFCTDLSNTMASTTNEQLSAMTSLVDDATQHLATYTTTVNEENTRGTTTFLQERMVQETGTHTQLTAKATVIREAVRR